MSNALDQEIEKTILSLCEWVQTVTKAHTTEGIDEETVQTLPAVVQGIAVLYKETQSGRLR